ncbi:hypothetical protein FQA47_017911 [Oryzias melastigma]|uniref:Uncharacterized protein n=1 Tax=Oryzias melastigma TaxID=30732 RepID=A0A834EXT7_ORYME|nr:hypothetical protein FQA47_017911 [Oryzias melastigma]
MSVEFSSCIEAAVSLDLSVEAGGPLHWEWNSSSQGRGEDFLFNVSSCSHPPPAVHAPREHGRRPGRERERGSGGGHKHRGTPRGKRTQHAEPSARVGLKVGVGTYCRTGSWTVSGGGSRFAWLSSSEKEGSEPGRFPEQQTAGGALEEEEEVSCPLLHGCVSRL